MTKALDYAVPTIYGEQDGWLNQLIYTSNAVYRSFSDFGKSQFIKCGIYFLRKHFVSGRRYFLLSTFEYVLLLLNFDREKTIQTYRCRGKSYLLVSDNLGIKGQKQSVTMDDNTKSEKKSIICNIVSLYKMIPSSIGEKEQII